MSQSDTPSIAVQEEFNLEVKPDIAIVKLYLTGEGMLMEDAAKDARRKVAEMAETLQGSHEQIDRIDVFDVYFGQQESSYSSKSVAYAPPLVIQGLLITVPPDDPAALYRIIDDGLKQGALLNNSLGHSCLVDSILGSALLYGLADSKPHEQEAIDRCLKLAEARGRTLAAAAGKRLGKLIDISASVEPSMGDPFQYDLAHIRRTFPTRFLSPTAHKVIICASLHARYELAES